MRGIIVVISMHGSTWEAIGLERFRHRSRHANCGVGDKENDGTSIFPSRKASIMADMDPSFVFPASPLPWILYFVSTAFRVLIETPSQTMSSPTTLTIESTAIGDLGSAGVAVCARLLRRCILAMGF